MPRHGGLVHEKLPPDAKLNVRAKDTPILAPDVDTPNWHYVALGLAAMQEALQELARQTENRGKVVDEYNTVPITGAASESILTVLPTYEYMPEKIEAILITGPPAASATLTLGDRQWSFIMPAAGILPIGPLAIILGRSDVRQLTSSTAGLWSMELMGIADKRFAI